MSDELWRGVVGYDGSYEVSSGGRIRSLVAKKPLLILRQYLRKDGYLQVQLKVRQRPNNQLVHRLVALAFLGDGDGKSVNHKNANKSDNRVENLEFLTQQENVCHAWGLGLCVGFTERNRSQEGRERSRADGVLRHKSGGLDAFILAGLTARRRAVIISRRAESGQDETLKFDSIVEAALHIGASKSHVCSAAKNNKLMAKGWRVEYEVFA